jgi:tetratricopeptide (TPR) repeat protein
MTVPTTNDPWKLVMAGRFQDAVEAYTREIAIDPWVGAYRGRAAAHLNLGDLDAALRDFRTAEEVRARNASRIAQIPTDAHSQDFGVVAWLRGQYQEAREHWARAVELLMTAGNVMTDAAGGVESGLLLWFAGVRLKAGAYREAASRLLERLCRSERIGLWPGPGALYVLGRISADAMFEAADSMSRMLTDRQMCQAHFYHGVQALSKGDFPLFAAEMSKAVARGESTRIEHEYYLAKYELGRAPTSPGA